MKTLIYIQYVVASQKIPVLLILYSISFLAYPSGELCLELRGEEDKEEKITLGIEKRKRKNSGN